MDKILSKYGFFQILKFSGKISQNAWFLWWRNSSQLRQGLTKIAEDWVQQLQPAWLLTKMFWDFFSFQSFEKRISNQISLDPGFITAASYQKRMMCSCCNLGLNAKTDICPREPDICLSLFIQKSCICRNWYLVFPHRNCPFLCALWWDCGFTLKFIALLFSEYPHHDIS